jgi:hypothetical protein
LDSTVQLDKKEWEAFLEKLSELEKKYQAVLRELDEAHSKLQALEKSPSQEKKGPPTPPTPAEEQQPTSSTTAPKKTGLLTVLKTKLQTLRIPPPAGWYLDPNAPPNYASCSRCRAKIMHAARFCDRCGANFGMFVCSCGRRLSESAGFCDHCGRRVEEEALQQAAG